MSPARSAAVRAKLVSLVNETAADLGLSTRQACLRIGLDPSRYCRLRAGRGEVGMAQILKTCEATGLTLSWFE